MSDVRSSWNAFGLVTGVVVLAVVLGAFGLGALTLADASNQYVELAVVQAEPQYSVVHGGDLPTVSYVVTTPRRADRYLESISWASDYYSTLDCHCVPSQQALVGAAGTNSSELRLIPQEPGPVALVELSGVWVGGAQTLASMYSLCPPPCPAVIPTVFEAPVAFLVVNLTDGKTTGGMIATPSDGSSSFSLAALGPVTSWSGPSDFGKPITGKVKVVLVDTPHQTQQ